MRDTVVQTSIIDIDPDSLLQPSIPALTANEIHIWQFSVLVSDAMLSVCAEALSPDERARASRFHFQKDTRRFTAARGTVRAILSGYAGQPADELRFVGGAHGKPGFADPASNLRFNISHSGDMALLGVALGREIGVDIEAIRPDVETDKLAERFFSPRERESIRALSPDDRVPAFFRCWSCKEAFLKAQGVGLSRSLSSFDVQVNPQLPARLLATRPDPAEAECWFLHEIETPPGYAAAGAVEGQLGAIKILRSHKN